MSDHVMNISRSATGRAWVWRSRPLPLSTASQLGVSDLAAQLLLSRGCEPQDVQRTLKPSLRDWLPDPSIFQGMDDLAKRLADAVEKRERIVLFADYDVDGATSAAFLWRHLRELGADVGTYIPDRMLEGYGPSSAALLQLQQDGAKLVVLLDCGTQAYGPLEAARTANLDMLIVDHHKASPELPPAIALVNPNRLDESAEAASFGILCTAGLAFLTGVALNRELRQRGYFQNRAEPQLNQWLDIVALGTVADVVPLLGLNRAFVALGLRRMAQRQSVGLSALADIARLTESPRSDDLGFHFGPRINAGGRVGQADLGVRLLASESPEEAALLAEELDQYNLQRREIEAAVTTEALEAAEAQANSPVVVVSGTGWHQGVVGIVASRLKERLNRPCIVLSLAEDGTAKGSGRSIPGVDLGAAILGAKSHGLIKEGGGHAMACGVTIEAGGIDKFSTWLAEKLETAVAAASGERTLSVDMAVSARSCTVDLVDALDAVGPYGQNWPAPRVAVGPVRLHSVSLVGKSEPKTHVRFAGSGPDGGRIEGIAFRATDNEIGQTLLAAGDNPVFLAGRISTNEWNGKKKTQILLDDIAVSG